MIGHRAGEATWENAQSCPAFVVTGDNDGLRTPTTGPVSATRPQSHANQSPKRAYRGLPAPIGTSATTTENGRPPGWGSARRWARGSARLGGPRAAAAP